MRERATALSNARAKLEAEVGAPLYFPFETSQRRPLRPMQGYLFKLPAFFIREFDVLAREPGSRPRPTPVVSSPDVTGIGSEYRQADADASVAQRDPFATDPALVERGLRGHAKTQNELADFLRAGGIEPLSPAVGEPNFDLAWTIDAETWVAEVKSLTDANEEKQLRLGLGQVLRYRHLLQARGKVRAVLVTEREPTDRSWHALCAEHGVVLAWPGAWPGTGSA